jgi:hypothetical protein
MKRKIKNNNIMNKNKWSIIQDLWIIAEEILNNYKIHKLQHQKINHHCEVDLQKE